MEPKEQQSKTALRPRHVQRAHEIYDHAEFFDERIKKRTIQVAIDKMARPARSLSRSSRGSARAKAAYRLVGNYKLRPGQKRHKRVTKEQLWEPIYAHDAARSKGSELIYAIQDSSCLMYPTLNKTKGLGTADKPKEEALWMHSAIGVRPDGYVLGLYHAHFWARPLSEFGKAAERKKRRFEDKESYLWVQTADAVETVLCAQGLDTNNVIHIADSASDVHEVLQHYVDTNKRFIIRFARDRRVAEQERYVRAQLAKQPVLDSQTITIPRTKEHPEREATVQVRACPITLDPPASKTKRPLTLNVVSVYEPHPPPDVDAIDWILYTRETVDTAQDCWALVGAYKLRWRIEDYHRALKTDCHAERTQLKTAESIVLLLAFLAVAAIRILQLRELARTNPTERCTVVLEDYEWRVLWLLFHEEPAPRGHDPPTVRDAVRMIGHLGGHLGRKSDGMPGCESLSLGLRELETAANVCRLLALEF